MSAPFAEGENYRIDVEDGHARASVWRRPDLDSARGAACAEEMVEHFGTLAGDPNIRSMLFDIREAPGFIGPRTQVALGGAFRAFEEARKPIAIVTLAAMQALQIQRMVGVEATLYGRDFRDVDEAIRWVRSER